MLSPIELARVARLQPALRAAVPSLVADVEQATGKHVAVTSGVRSTAEQQALWNARATSPYPVAAPGTSYHEYGAAVDLAIQGGTDSDYARQAEIAEQTYNFVSGWPDDNVHIRLNESLDQAKADWAQVSSVRQTTIGIGVVVLGIVLLLSFTSGD